MIIHSVYFWLKTDVPTGTEADMEQALLGLAAVHGVQRLSVGRPAAVPSRPVLEAGYTLALVLEVADLAAMAAYQNHPLHLEFLDRFSKLWTKVTVFDVQV